MMNAKVTVVLPIYNVEKYLERCIESIVHQTHTNLEIILVNDCSTDSSQIICDRWAQKDSRIRVIHKILNEGQGIARNDAMALATGDYICFFDSDDYVLPNMIEKMLVSIIKTKAQVAVCGMRNIDKEGEEASIFVLPRGERTYRDQAVVEQFLPEFIAPDPRGNGEQLFYMSACMALYNMQILQKLNWSFVSEREIISEDLYSLLDLFSDITSITIVPDALYCYCYNEESFSRRYRPDRYREIKRFYNETMILCEKKGYGDAIRYRIAKPYLSYTIGTLKQEAKAPCSIRKQRENVFRILNDDLFCHIIRQHANDHVGLKQKILFRCLRKGLKNIAFLLFKLQK